MNSPAGACGGGSGSSKGRPQNEQNAIHWVQFVGPFLAGKAGPELCPFNRNVYVGEFQIRSQKGSHKLLQLNAPSGDYRLSTARHFCFRLLHPGPGRDGTGRDGTGRNGTGRDGTGRDGTGRDGMGRDGTGRDGLIIIIFNNYYTDCFDSRIARVA